MKDKSEEVWTGVDECGQCELPKHAVIDIQSFDIVVAPKVGSHSNSWTSGRMHRDTVSINRQECFSYTVILFLVDVTERNGMVRLWPRTVDHVGELDRKHSDYGFPKGVMDDFFDATGKAGSVLVFDSAMYHRSAPNSTQHDRPVIVFNVIVNQSN